MNKAAANKTTTKGGKNQQSTIDGWVIALQLADTSWRVALPILLFCYAGIRLDRHFHTNPLYTLIGLFLSLFVAIVLVYKQVKDAYPEFFKKEGRL